MPPPSHDPVWAGQRAHPSAGNEVGAQVLAASEDTPERRDGDQGSLDRQSRSRSRRPFALATPPRRSFVRYGGVRSHVRAWPAQSSAGSLTIAMERSLLRDHPSIEKRGSTSGRPDEEATEIDRMSMEDSPGVLPKPYRPSRRRRRRGRPGIWTRSCRSAALPRVLSIDEEDDPRSIRTDPDPMGPPRCGFHRPELPDAGIVLPVARVRKGEGTRRAVGGLRPGLLPAG